MGGSQGYYRLLSPFIYMSTSPLWVWITDHPYIAFLISWPCGFTLALVAWSVASAITNTVSVLCGTAQALATTALLVLRGYPPAPPEDPEPPEDKPLAS